jgi:hypothetical protein
VWLNENKKKKQKAEHDPVDTCRSKVFVYYDVFKGFLNTDSWVQFKLMILGLRLTLPPPFELMKKKKFYQYKI